MAYKHKYNAVPTEVDGIRFASRKEAARYGELKLLLKAGQIRGLMLQPSFTLNAWRPDHSECPKVADYRADFEYEERIVLGDRECYARATLPGRLVQWVRVVEDVKGMKTPLYRLKKKFVEAQYGIVIRET
jgi:hypothetical protein